jgi:hypothetical protein
MQNGLLRLLRDRHAVAIGSSVLILLIGALGKCLIRRRATWQEFYLGFDATLAGFYAGIVYLYDIANDKSLQTSDRLTLLGSYLLVSFVVFLIVTGFHMKWEELIDGSARTKQIVMLGVMSNIMGFGMLVVFVMLIKGV